MTNYRNIPLPPRLMFGRGAINQLEEILRHQRKNMEAPFLFLIDKCFETSQKIEQKISLKGTDFIRYVDTTFEPKTRQVDTIRDALLETFGTNISGIIGIGGGSVMDVAKAVALMVTNKGSSADYQGWDLIQHPALFKAGIPTLSGTGAEVSRTCVLMGPEKKLGINSDYTPFDQIILDPELIADVPDKQRFYTGMDCYIHCIESLTGTYINEFSRVHGQKALDLCRTIFLEREEWTTDSDDKLMMASFLGGISIATSQVGVVHALSYGLSYLLGIKHGEGNCIVLNKIENYYPDGYREFQKMLEKHDIKLRKNICIHVNDSGFDKMADVAIGLEPLWENALGNNWKEKINKNVLKEYYQRM